MKRNAAAIAFLVVTALLYFAGQDGNPPGFFLDESSIAYNALTIARHGVDEHGIAFPLFFRAFGEYKNPVYIYGLAAVFKVVPPGTLAARRFSAVCGLAAALVLGWLAWRITRRRSIALITYATALATPNLFEISRVTFEVALYPLVLALFLLAAYRAFAGERWSARLIAALLVTLTLLTYTYSIGRLHAPLLLGTLAVLAFNRRRLAAIAILVAGHVLLAVVPLVVYNARNGGALTIRAKSLTYAATYEHDPLGFVPAFARHYLANINPAGYVLRGDPNPRHHVEHSGGSVLAVSLLLALGSIVLLARRRERWWWFVVAATFLSVVPAALTNDAFHSLRLVPYPIFLIVLSIPALEALTAHRAALALVLAIGLAQWGWFIHVFARDGGKRENVFDGGFRRTLNETLALTGPPIELRDAEYIHGYWFGALIGVDKSAFVKLDHNLPDPGATYITVYGCDGCEVLNHHGIYTAYRYPR